MNSKLAKRLRGLLMPAQKGPDGRRLSTGALLRGTTSYEALTVAKEATFKGRVRWGRTPDGQRVIATQAVQGRLTPDCPRAMYKRMKRSLTLTSSFQM